MTTTIRQDDDAMRQFLLHYRRGLPLKDARYRTGLGPAARIRFELLRLVRPVWHPMKRLLEIVDGSRTWGGAVRAAGGPPVYRQVAQQLSLAARHGIRPVDYYQFMLYRPELRAVADRFIYHHQMEVALKYLKQFVSERDLDALKSKVAFYRFCQRHDIQTIPVLAVIHDRAVEWIETKNEADVPATGLFSKPDDMGEGKGVRAWRLREPGVWTDRDGSPHSFVDVLESLRRQSVSLGRSILLQPKIDNHPDIAAMTGRDSLCASRIVSVRDQDGRHFILPALLGIPFGDSETSNFVPGGPNLGAPVHPETGRLGAARSKEFSTIMIEHTHHPDTGEPIEGVILPGWQDAVDLCTRAHAALENLPFVGWDVGFTPQGPVIVEGNQGFGAVSPQLTHLKPFGDTPFPFLFDWHVRRLAGDPTPPS